MREKRRLLVFWLVPSWNARALLSLDCKFESAGEAGSCRLMIPSSFHARNDFFEQLKALGSSARKKNQ